MSNFKERVLNLGEVKVNTKKKVFFSFNGEVNNIKKVTGSCSCTTPKVKKDGIEVIFKSGNFPKHLIGRDYYEVLRQIIVTFDDGIKEILSFKAKIVKK